jgi:hypothetical protein
MAQNPKVRHHIHNSLPLGPILSHLNPLHTPQAILPKIHSDPILPSTPQSCEWSVSSGFSHQNLVHFSVLSHMSYMPHRPHPPSFTFILNKIKQHMTVIQVRWKVQISCYITFRFCQPLSLLLCCIMLKIWLGEEICMVLHKSVRKEYLRWRHEIYNTHRHANVENSFFRCIHN